MKISINCDKLIEKNILYGIIFCENKKGRIEMKEKKDKEKKKKTKEQRNYDKSQIFVKIMAGILVILMLAATAMTLIFALFG